MRRPGRPVHARRRRCMMDWMSCASMPGSPRKLPLQEFARTIKYWSVPISHVHWARQFKLSWSRQHNAAVPREHMIEVHRVHVKDMVWCLSS